MQNAKCKKEKRLNIKCKGKLWSVGKKKDPRQQACKKQTGLLPLQSVSDH